MIDLIRIFDSLSNPIRMDILLIIYTIFFEFCQYIFNLKLIKNKNSKNKILLFFAIIIFIFI